MPTANVPRRNQRPQGLCSKWRIIYFFLNVWCSRRTGKVRTTKTEKKNNASSFPPQLTTVLREEYHLQYRFLTVTWLMVKTAVSPSPHLITPLYSWAKTSQDHQMWTQGHDMGYRQGAQYFSEEDINTVVTPFHSSHWAQGELFVLVQPQDMATQSSFKATGRAVCWCMHCSGYSLILAVKTGKVSAKKSFQNF